MVAPKGKKKPKKKSSHILSPHNNGQWCKSINGKKEYFGPWSDYDAAEKRYLHFKEAGAIGAKPKRRASKNAATVRELCDSYLGLRATDVKSGGLSRRQWENLLEAGETLIDAFGDSRAVAAIDATGLARLKEQMAKGAIPKKSKPSASVKPSTLKRRMTNVRTILNYAMKSQTVDCLIPLAAFKPPSDKDVRRARHEDKRKHGEKRFTKQEVALMLQHADTSLTAMILLGLNCGSIPSDIKTMTVNDLDFEGGWLGQYRRKAVTDRRAKLWPETVAALKRVVEARRKPKDTAHSDYIFITKYGNPWGVPEKRDCPITKAFGKLMEKTELKRTGHTFTALRSTYRTRVVGLDEHAVKLTMGHVDRSIAASYIQKVSDKLLTKIAKKARKSLAKHVRNQEK